MNQKIHTMIHEQEKEMDGDYLDILERELATGECGKTDSQRSVLRLWCILISVPIEIHSLRKTLAHKCGTLESYLKK